MNPTIVLTPVIWGTSLILMAQDFDWQGHRGCRGILPENSIPGFLKALEYDIRTLELDIVVSKDRELIVSHEPWFSHEICRHADGSPVTHDSIRLMDLDYAEIKAYDCGSRGHTRFPEQTPVACSKPSLRDAVLAVEQYCIDRGRRKPHYNIEIKCRPEWDGILTPDPISYVTLVIQKISALPIAGRCHIQSFDPRILREMKRQAPDIPLALLIENERTPEENLRELGFIPAIYSPYFKLLDRKTMRKLHRKGLKVVPWTVNETRDMARLIRMGVDGIITDYPNRISLLK